MIETASPVDHNLTDRRDVHQRCDVRVASDLPYVVAYDGLDPLTCRERRRWVPTGHDRGEAEAVVADSTASTTPDHNRARGTVTVGEFLTCTWMPNKRRLVRATTAYRYAWFIDRYINPAIGDIPLRRLRSDHLDGLYERLATTGGRQGTGLAPKTIAEVHMIVRAALDNAGSRELIAYVGLTFRDALGCRGISDSGYNW